MDKGIKINIDGEVKMDSSLSNIENKVQKDMPPSSTIDTNDEDDQSKEKKNPR